MIKIHYNFPINLQNRTWLWWRNIYQHMLHLLSSTLHGELDLNSLYDLLTSLCIIIRKKQPRSNKFYIPISRVVAFHQYDFAYIQQASSWTSSSPNIGILRTFTFEAFYDIFMIYIGHHWNSTTRHGCEEIFKFSYFWLHITFISK